MIVAHSRPVDTLVKELEQRYSMSNEGTLKFCLGMEVSRDVDKRTAYLSQKLYINKMLRRFGLSDPEVRTHATPAETSKLSKSMCPAEGAPRPTAPGPHGFTPSRYRELVGSLLYCAICTRPDISFAVGACARYVSNPGKAHFKAAQRILRYLKRTIDFKLPLGGTSPLLFSVNDSDWDGDDVHTDDTFRSTSGILVFFGKYLVHWSSKLQRSVARSSVEAEYRALSTSSDTVLWLRNVLEELGLEQQSPTLMFTDSRGAKLNTVNQLNQRKLRHVEIAVHAIRERSARRQIRAVWTPKEENPADALTKPLPRPLFEKFRSVLFGLAPLVLPQLGARQDKSKTNTTEDLGMIDILRKTLLDGDV